LGGSVRRPATARRLSHFHLLAVAGRGDCDKINTRIKITLDSGTEEGFVHLPDTLHGRVEMKRNRTHFLIVAVLIGVSSVGLYFLLDVIYQLPKAASAEAAPIDQLFNAHFIMIAFLFSLIMVVLVYSVFAFRKKPGDETDGVHFHGNTSLEIGWTIVPLIAVLGFGLWGAIVLRDVTEVRDNEMVVNVTGRQWSWVFSYPDHNEVGNSPDLVLPVNRTIRLHMNATDVLHSFWVPEFRVKQDLVPGMETTLRITPTVIGEYKVRCAEICGFGHAKMLATVKVVSEADFEAWAASFSGALAEANPADRGGKWAVDFGCVSCHSTDGSVLVGPSWAGLFGRVETLEDGSTVTVDEAYIRQSILNPNSQIVSEFPANVMPGDFEEKFMTAENDLQAGIEIDIVDDLIAYIMTLRAAETE
jgi:cytochrome c oxidase subunit II